MYGVGGLEDGTRVEMRKWRGTGSRRQERKAGSRRAKRVKRAETASTGTVDETGASRTARTLACVRGRVYGWSRWREAGLCRAEEQQQQAVEGGGGQQRARRPAASAGKTVCSDLKPAQCRHGVREAVGREGRRQAPSGRAAIGGRVAGRGSRESWGIWYYGTSWDAGVLGCTGEWAGLSQSRRNRHATASATGACGTRERERSRQMGEAAGRGAKSRGQRTGAACSAERVNGRGLERRGRRATGDERRAAGAANQAIKQASQLARQRAGEPASGARTSISSEPANQLLQAVRCSMTHQRPKLDPRDVGGSL